MFKQGFMFAILAASVWGLAPLFAKVGLVKTDPLIGVAMRSMAVTAVVLTTIVVAGQQRALFSAEPRALVVLAVEGLLAGLIGQYFYFKAIKSLEASTVAPIVGSYPLFTFIFAILILGERITLTKGLGALLAVSGIVLLGM